MTDKQDILKEYKTLQGKYKELPNFEDLDKEFELSNIDKKEFLTRLIRRKMNDKLIFFCRILEGILYPTERSPLSAYESQFFDEQTKQELAKTHKLMMIYERKSLLLDVDVSEQKDIDFILELWKAWTSFKGELSQTVGKMEKSWGQEMKKDKGEGYFG